ncbi:ultraviolet N-glycosylase/AP lyase [Anaerotignum neopropionicum]|uniref:Endonuclease III n=2 Tax=Anaerotignum neopropionicum TaxID=36847 RepID=A0A136WG56_9FIRM|nr:ultraviolet N-glycosylase/AP lyase [Anaerotignum neopropionicum]
MKKGNISWEIFRIFGKYAPFGKVCGKMTKEEKVKQILFLLQEQYGPTKCYLDHENPWQLLVATILSAQCTDERVNIVTMDLFQKYKSVKDFAEANLKELENDIHSTGFYHNKAKNIIACCQKLLAEYNGQVPSDLEALTSLAGVGRKTANVVRGNWYGIPSIVVDTHVKRLSNLLGLTKNQDPVKIEFDLMKIIPKENWIAINTQLIAHGRKICIARRPKCAECLLLPYCTGGQKQQKEK